MNPVCDLKGTGRDKTVWLIGNGPSLDPTHLDAIAARGDHSIAMNRISLIYPRTSWRPTYYLFCSTNCRHPRWGRAWCESIIEAANGSGTIPFIALRYKDDIEGAGFYYLTDRTRYLTHLSEYPIGHPLAFSTDAAIRLDKSGTSMNVALQLAYYFGYSHTYLLGCDSNWQTATDTPSQGDPNHFDADYHAHIADGAEEFRRMNETHKLARTHFDAAGLHIANATPGSALTAYHQVDVDALLDTAPGA